MPQVKGTALEKGRQGKWKERLAALIDNWERMRQRIRELPDDVYNNKGQLVDNPQVVELREKRRHLVNQIRDIADARDLHSFAVKQGFREDLLRYTPTPDAGGGGDTAPGKTDDGPRTRPPRDRDDDHDDSPPTDHLPGKRGRDYHFVRGPGGTVKVVYKMDIPGPRKGAIAFTVPKELYDRYNVNPDEVKRLTKEQMKRLDGFGPINEIKLRKGEHPFKSWMREMENKFGTAPGMLRNKEVMQTLYAAHLGKWDQAELMGALQQTKWYDKKTEARVTWLFNTTKADKQTKVNAAMNQLQDFVRSAFGGIDWTEHGLTEDKLKNWARKVASGATGWDPLEAQSRINHIARNTRGTTLWAQEEQAAEMALSEMQEWEDIFESMRTQNIQWLGPHARSSRETLTDWAKKMAAGKVTQADYNQYLRKQAATLHPYIADRDMPWQQFADPYKATISEILRTPVDWNDPLLRSLEAVDENGQPTGRAMTFHEFEMKARQDPRAWQQGTRLYEEGLNVVSALENVFAGVTF